VPLERKPVLLGPIQWVDVAGRALRRTWMTHWRRQYVEILPLVQTQQEAWPPARPPRAVRSHQSFRWQDRLACNAWLTTATACHCRWRSLFSGRELIKEELANRAVS
jgi:hypothetical protein